MAELFASGRMIDLILALTVLEGIALALYHSKTGRGPTPGAVLGTLLPGLFLMLTVRSALIGEEWGWMALYLLAALITHLMDLARRWPR
jgi:hypothetical protein